MHLLVHDTTTLDDQEQAIDLGHAPADIVFLSFSDADLTAVAAAWQTIVPQPTLRLASLARLRHPMSVDLYAEQVIEASRCVIVRLLGGLDYWRYGVDEFATICRTNGIPFAVIPGDGLEDPRLADLSTVGPADHARMDQFLRHGGPANLANAVRLANAWAGLARDEGWTPEPLPAAGVFELPHPTTGPLAVITFYRSHLLSNDIAPILALAEALATRGLGVRALYLSSLKDPAAASFVADHLRAWNPAIVLNATLFSAWRESGGTGSAGGTLETSGCPVLQLIQAVGTRAAWHSGFRGLSQTDLAMQVVLPELDGRLLSTAISFKAEAEPMPGLDFARTINRPDDAGIALAADRAAGWVRLATTPPADRDIAIVLSDYPGATGQTGHAVGLDSFASLAAILDHLLRSGHTAETPNAQTLIAQLCHAEPTAFIALKDYQTLYAALPEPTRNAITQAWGEPSDDPAASNGHFHLRHARLGRILLAVQPDRGHLLDRKSGYHDADLPPRHAYVAFYLALRQHTHALIHLGTHGTLEWLPGKAAALSESCAPTALLRGLPVIYPFIVNNPGEAAAAKRRLGAVTIGHMTPKLTSGGAHLHDLDRLIDEYAAADGLDRKRSAILRRDILERATQTGLLAEAGADSTSTDDEALARLDAYLCDVKDLQIRDGLHIFGQHGHESETAALLAAIAGKFVPPGPAGAPSRGRADVLPTGRNLFAIDPRAVPTRSAVALAEKSAEELLRRHRQDHGVWLSRIVIDLWGNTTLRTGGEDLALALLLMGVRPRWDEGSARVSGFDTIPLALLDRPRVDVTLRISGLFRDIFETQIALFDAAVRAVAARDEAPDWNPLAGHTTARVFGAAPGAYGTDVAPLLERGAWNDRAALGAAYLAASAYDQKAGATDQQGFADRVTAAEAFLHQQDHAETDLLDSPDYAAHEGGFAAAADLLGATPAMYHADTSTPETPKMRTLGEEIARITRGRAANPAWIKGQMRHGYQGAAEIARALESLHGFAATLPQRLDRQFDLLFDATLGNPETDAFLRTENPHARAAMAQRFQDALTRDLWRPQRNSIAEVISP